MKFWGVLDILQQHCMIKEQQDLIEAGAFIPLYPEEISSFSDSEDGDFHSKNIDAAVVALIEVSVVVKSAHLTQLKSGLQELLIAPIDDSFSFVVAAPSANNEMRNGRFSLEKPEMIGGYVCFPETDDSMVDSRRYVCLQKVTINLKEHELKSILLFIQYIIDSVKDFASLSGSCTFEYPYWSQALRECSAPAFNVIVV